MEALDYRLHVKGSTHTRDCHVSRVFSCIGDKNKLGLVLYIYINIIFVVE